MAFLTCFASLVGGIAAIFTADYIINTIIIK